MNMLLHINRGRYRMPEWCCHADQPSNSTSADSNQFSTSAAAWISGLIMVFFLVTGCYCLANMQFKQDSLLYPRTKTD